MGVSFKSTDQACSNAEIEVGSSSFDEIVAQSKALWNEKLGKIEIDVANTPANVTEMLYSSLYRSFLTPVSASFRICAPIARRLTQCTRITRRTRLKARSQIRHIITLILSTVGKWHFVYSVDVVLIVHTIAGIHSARSIPSCHSPLRSSSLRLSTATSTLGGCMGGCLSAARTTCEAGHKEVSFILRAQV